MVGQITDGAVTVTTTMRSPRKNPSIHLHWQISMDFLLSLLVCLFVCQENPLSFKKRKLKLCEMKPWGRGHCVLAVRNPKLPASHDEGRVVVVALHNSSPTALGLWLLWWRWFLHKLFVPGCGHVGIPLEEEVDKERHVLLSKNRSFL